MRSFRHIFLFIFALGLIVVSVEQAEAKKKSEKAMPVKIIKASETQFKHAKIVQTKEVKPKRFLWFKKKNPKVKKPKMARIAQSPVNTDILEPRVEQPTVLPTPQAPVKGEDATSVQKLDVSKDSVPLVVVPEAL